MPTGIDTDKYYTPTPLASRALERAQLMRKPAVCADTACGSGSLLIAAEDVLGAKHCVGIDNDPLAIRRLRRARPDWRLYVGDLLKRHRAPPTDFPDATYGADLLVLNPPFSLGHRKYVPVKYSGQLVKCSVAMAHILRSLELFRPNQGAIAVIPESLLYSNTDQHARELLERSFSIAELLHLSIYTFKGARVNSLFVQFATHGNTPKPSAEISTTQEKPITATIVRGGLQMHSAKPSSSGARVIHSTSLRSLSIDGISSISQRTSSTAKGRVSGWMLFLPRVGLPNKEAFQAVYSIDEIQLSDCVIGLVFRSRTAASEAQRRVHSNWSSLLSMYRGTGARYITIDRLVDWLHNVGIHNKDAFEEVARLTHT